MKTNRAISGIPILFVVCALAVHTLTGQTGNGVVQGTVLDASKAVVPAARTTLTNTQTGVIKSTISSSAGVYYFGAVAPGDYTLAIEAAGFI